MPTAREVVSAASVGGKLYVIAGCDRSPCWIGTNEAYTPVFLYFHAKD